MGTAILLFYFLFPAIILFMSTRFHMVNRIGIVVICYAGGLMLGNMGIVPVVPPEGVTPDPGDELFLSLQDAIRGASILLGIPLVLFSENITRWFRIAKYTFISLLLGVVSVVVLVIAGYFVFRNAFSGTDVELWKVCGMMIGVYTGGTPNLAGIAMSLDVDNDVYILTHTVELVIGAVILLFLITGAKPFFGLFLKPYHSDNESDKEDIDMTDFESYHGFFHRIAIPGILKSFGVGLVILGIGFGMNILFGNLFPDNEEAGGTAAVLTVTTLGILASLIPQVNRMKHSFQLGMYFIYLFCVIVASQANLSSLFADQNMDLLLNMFLFIGMVILGSLVLHALLSRIFGINVDDYIITSTALSNSPPFVPVVAAALRNKEVVIPGMIIGVIGYAIGNYLGVAIALLLK